MERQEFKQRLDDLRNIITEGITCFSAWYRLANLDNNTAHALNRYRAFFLPVRASLNHIALLQFAKVFDKDSRTASLPSLLSVARNNPKLLLPHAEAHDLHHLEQKIENNKELLEHLKNYRDQRIAHHDSVIERDTSLPFGKVKQLIDDVIEMYNLLSKWHERSTTSFDFISHETDRHTSEVIQIMCEERNRAKLKIQEARRRIERGD